MGGQLRHAIRAPRHDGYAAYLDWQRRRLAALGIDVQLDRQASVDDVLAVDADVVAIATGATFEHVLDIRDVLAERRHAGHRVLIVAQDDHVAPLSVADFLSSRGHEVTIVYATQGPAPLLGRYIIGALLGRLSDQGVQMEFMEDVVAITAGGVETRNVYSWRPRVIPEVDSVVLACGSVSDSTLYDALKHRIPNIHILGDAYAPRRLVFATRQAYALAEQLVS